MIELESMAVAMPFVEGHPNRADFRGVLTLVDVPSQGSPHGAHGHRVILTKAVAERALASLIGMALDYAPSFDGHDVRRKVGVITRADVLGRNLEIGGYLFAKDFPDIVQQIAKLGGKPAGATTSKLELPGRGRAVRPANGYGKTASLAGSAAGEGHTPRMSLAQAVQGIRGLMPGKRSECSCERNGLILRAETAGASGGPGLGMSYELTNVEVVDRRAGTWILKQATFTGAAILKRNKAAYQDTWIELI